jgi:23S rRNA pseudouridine2457 synthase
MKHYFVVHKPYGMLSQFSPEGKHSTLGQLYDFPPNVYPVGRLDADSEGLLIITNDRQLNHLLLHPARGHWRTYHAQVEGLITEEALEKLRSGITISLQGNPYVCKPARAAHISDPGHKARIPPVRYRKHIPDSWVEISTCEGKNRQVRRMLAAVGFPVLRLIRIAIEDLRLNSLQAGEVREENEKDIYRKLNISL